mmetsp:Transcript_150106/g.262161  ORF Transcript_150106/g.262161 Transcript_150106/m.262161 type:complete len:85 (-) Transcript_150106:1603-1857(-)
MPICPGFCPTACMKIQHAKSIYKKNKKKTGNEREKNIQHKKKSGNESFLFVFVVFHSPFPDSAHLALILFSGISDTGRSNSMQS